MIIAHIASVIFPQNLGLYLIFSRFASMYYLKERFAWKAFKSNKFFVHSYLKSWLKISGYFSMHLSNKYQIAACLPFYLLICQISQSLNRIVIHIIFNSFRDIEALNTCLYMNVSQISQNARFIPFDIEFDQGLISKH